MATARTDAERVQPSCAVGLRATAWCTMYVVNCMLHAAVASCKLHVARAVWTRLDVPQVEHVRRVDQHHDTPCVAFVLSVSRNVTTTKKQQVALQQTRRDKQHCNKHVGINNKSPAGMRRPCARPRGAAPRLSSTQRAVAAPCQARPRTALRGGERAAGERIVRAKSMRHIVARRTAALCRSAHVARASAIRRLTSLCLAHGVAHAARVVGAVREADDVDARWDVQRVVRVEVAAEHALVTAARTRQHMARQGAAARAVVSVSVCRFRVSGF